MTTQQVTYCTTKKIDCCPIAAVILCVPTVLLVNQSGFLEASMTAVSQSNTLCGGQCYYTYTFEYDDAFLLNPETPLLPTEISGVICTGCLTNWIESRTLTYENLYVNTTDAFNINASEQTLMSYTVPGMTLQTDFRDRLEVAASGVYSVTANNKRIRVYFDNTVIFDTGALGILSRTWDIRLSIIRINVGLQFAYARYLSYPITVFGNVSGLEQRNLSSANLAVDAEFKITAEAAGVQDITEELLIVDKVVVI